MRSTPARLLVGLSFALLADCVEESGTPPAPVVATVTVSPDAATVPIGGTLQLTATAKDAAGNPVSGPVVTWASSAPAAVPVSGSGLVTGVGPASAVVTATSEGKSDSSAILITVIPRPAAGSCLAQAGSTITLSGVRASPYYNTSLADGTKIDASTAQFLTEKNIAIMIGGGANVCFHGGETIGHRPPSTPWSPTTFSIVADGPNVTVEDIRTFNRADGVSFTAEDAVATNAPNWVVRRAYVKYARDGCVENHFVFSGTVDESLLDGCFIGFASRPYTTTQDGSNNVMTIKNSLIRLQPMDGVFVGPTIPGHGGFFEWSDVSPKLVLHNDVFRVDQTSNNTDEYLAPPPGKLGDCSNNVMIWLGPGPFPEPLPSCFTLLTGPDGLEYWNRAVAQWTADHPTALPDVGPPIVSLFAPPDGATLAGLVALTATAVDNRAVAGVQFQLNGEAIGPEVTTESPSTKFTLSWDSRGKANGTHTLMATARDQVGNTTTSAPITVTINNN